jgi:hypothetical protein
MLLLREGQYLALPWKNGGGITREIHREPSDPAPFDWRLSLASIDRAGPFSAFPGYQRTLVLVRGAGVELDFGAHGAARLAQTGQSATFDGGWPTHCRLIQGPSTDLNLIVSCSRAQSTARCMRLAAAEHIETAGWTETLLCCLAGSIELSNALGERGVLRDVEVARCFETDGVVTCQPGTPAGASLFLASLRRRAPG